MAAITAKTLQDITKAVKQAEDKNKKVQAQYKEVAKKLSGAIKDKNESMVKLYRTQFQKVEKEIADCIQLVEYAISRVKELQKSEEFMEKRFATVEKLLKGVSQSRTQLTKQLLESKKLGQAAVDALHSLTNDLEDAASEYARLEDAANDLEKRLKKIRPLAKKHEEAADKAIAARDQKALTAARVALLNLKFGSLQMAADHHMPRVKQFLKKYRDTELKTDANWLHDRFESLSEEFGEYDKRIMDLVKRGQVAANGSGKGSVNIAKAAKVLGVAKKDQPRLAKALALPAGTPREKKLSALAADLGLDEVVGKKITAKLVKAKVLEA